MFLPCTRSRKVEFPIRQKWKLRGLIWVWCCPTVRRILQLYPARDPLLSRTLRAWRRETEIRKASTVIFQRLFSNYRLRRSYFFLETKQTCYLRVKILSYQSKRPKNVCSESIIWSEDFPSPSVRPQFQNGVQYTDHDNDTVKNVPSVLYVQPWSKSYQLA